MARFYECVEDLQGGWFAVGYIGTPKFWKKTALDWCDGDHAYEYADFIKKNIFGKEVIDEVAMNWAIDLKPVKPTNCRCPKCHKKMFYSDLNGYDYQCIYCDEDFYKSEVENG